MVRLAGLVAALVALSSMAAAEDDTGQFGQQHNESLFWGPYKPNLYFGLRSRAPHGLWMGMAWAKMEQFSDLQTGFRYTCEQGDEMRGYGWDEFDAHHGGVQSIHDVANKVDITTSFVKVPGGDRGGSWAARIKGELRPDAPADMQILIFLYFAQEGGGQLYVDTQGTEFGFDDDVAFRGTSPSLGRYEIAVTKGRGEHPSMDHEHTIDKRHGDTTLVDSISLPDDLVWQAKQVVFRQLQEALVGIKDEIDADNPPPAWQIYQLGNNPGSGNVHVVQKTFQGPFEFDVIFSSESAGEPLTSSTMTSRISETSKSFDDRFARVFDLKAPFSAKKYQAFAKSMLSNLLGGVGYFYGNQVVDRSQAPEYDEDDERFWIGAAEARARNQQALEGPYELISSVPSRPFFPRGFLWDEGFHLLLISDWDMDVALEIMQSWYNTMDYDGWIPREQILGAEARSKVPEEFQVQYPHYANPPTLCLVLEQYLDRVGELTGSDERRAWVPYDAHVDDKKAARDFLQQLYPKLRRQYDWFRKTQRGDVKSYGRDAFSTKEAYRWRGRSETHVLPSGLDDYPRPQPPSPSELHVDLISWVGLMTKTLLRTAEALDLLEEAAELKKNLHALRQNVEDLHWSESEGCYCDATVDDFEEHKLVCHKGYLSLFPFLVGLMDRDDPKLGKILDLIGDEQHLFSKHGIRSLSKQDPNYGTNEDYWRSPVWIPINYLIASQLHDLATHDGPHQTRARDLYVKIRHNLVETVFKSWDETGFAWEQYNPDTGKGQRTKHFTGWTSLVVKLMAMDDLSGEHVKDEL